MSWRGSSGTDKVKNSCISPTNSNKRNLSWRKLRNNRDNEGFLNKSIRITSTFSRSTVTYSFGAVDKKFGTAYAPKIFTFQSDFVKASVEWNFMKINIILRDFGAGMMQFMMFGMFYGDWKDANLVIIVNMLTLVYFLIHFVVFQ